MLSVSCSHGLRLRWPVDIYLKWKNASTRECNDDFIELEVNIAAHHFGLLCLWTRQRRGVSELVGVTDPGHQEERGLLLLQLEEKRDVWNREDPLGNSLSGLRSMENYNSQIEARLPLAQNHPEWRFGSLHLAKNYDQLRCLLKVKRIQNE